MNITISLSKKKESKSKKKKRIYDYNVKSCTMSHIYVETFFSNAVEVAVNKFLN
jgi:hypothetical protein